MMQWITDWITSQIANGISGLLACIEPIMYYGCEMAAMIFYLVWLFTEDKNHKNKCIVSILIYFFYKVVTLPL